MPYRSASSTSVPIMAFSSKDHRHAMPIRGADQLGIAARPTWLDDGRDTGIGRPLERIREREEPVGGHNGALRPLARLADRQVDPILAPRLGRTKRDQRGAPGQ